MSDIKQSDIVGLFFESDNKRMQKRKEQMKWKDYYLLQNQ